MHRVRNTVIAALLLASCSNSKTDPEALCQLLADSEQLNPAAELVPLEDYVEVVQNMTIYVELFAEMADVSPKSVKPDFETVRDFMASVRDAKEFAAGDRVVEIAEIQRSRDEAIGLQAATARVLAYARNECSIEL